MHLFLSFLNRSIKEKKLLNRYKVLNRSELLLKKNTSRQNSSTSWCYGRNMRASKCLGASQMLKFHHIQYNTRKKKIWKRVNGRVGCVYFMHDLASGFSLSPVSYVHRSFYMYIDSWIILYNNAQTLPRFCKGRNPLFSKASLIYVPYLIWMVRDI